MNKVKGITVGTYLTKTIKNSKDKDLSSKEICNHCKMNDPWFDINLIKKSLKSIEKYA